MHAAFGERLPPAETLARLLGDGRLGRKNGRGFYRYHDGHKAGVDDSVYPCSACGRWRTPMPAWCERRLVHAMLNEAAMALDEGVVAQPARRRHRRALRHRLPPFRGGPLRMIDDLTATRVVEVLHELQDVHGPRFAPAVSLVEMATHGSRYYAYLSRRIAVWLPVRSRGDATPRRSPRSQEPVMLTRPIRTHLALPRRASPAVESGWSRGSCARRPTRRGDGC